MNITILQFETVDSTNTEALKQARLGASEGLCIVAREQTAGRGRHGRQWSSAKDAGLYFSIVLRPKLEREQLTLITLMAGVAVHESLSELGLKPDIKWVNDLLVDDKKICGILAETTETNNGIAVVVGIGINLRSDNFPPDVADTATSIEAAGAVDAGSLVEGLTRNLARYYEVLSGPGGLRAIVDEWKSRSTYFSGKSVRVMLDNETLIGTTDGLEADGALRIKRDDGSVTIVHAGDVERLRAAE